MPRPPREQTQSAGNDSLLTKIQRQFQRLDEGLDSLEEEMRQAGWLPDPRDEAAAALAPDGQDLPPTPDEPASAPNGHAAATTDHASSGTAADAGAEPARPRQPR